MAQVQGKIRWKRGDYVALGRAVSEFNKKVKRLQSEEITYLPEIKDYKELKGNIITRAELNRVIASLKRFQREGSEQLYKFANQEITKWEFRRIKKASKNC